MALLIVEHDGKVEAGVISGRVVIGRRPESQVRATDKSVALIHAWIGVAEDNTHFIADTGSRSGTFVNGQRVVVRQALRAGDQIRIGPLKMKLADGQTIPFGAEPLDLHARDLPMPTPQTGISFDCDCGAPMWVPWSSAGKSGRCRVCGAGITVPEPPAQAQPEPPEELLSGSQCGVCHATIEPREESTRCPDCGAVFHVECWTENGGCAVYGCSQVNVLAPAIREPDAVGAASHVDEEIYSVPQGGMSLAYLFLAVSVLAALGGALTFGATAILAAAAALLYLVRARPKRQRRVVFLSIAVSLTGAVAGVALSYYWWIAGMP